MSLPFLNESLQDSGSWQVIATVSHPFQISDISAGHLQGIYRTSSFAVKSSLSQVGTDGYRETSLMVASGLRRNHLTGLVGIRLGRVDVPPLPIRYREAVHFESQWVDRWWSLGGRYQFPLQNFGDPVALPRSIAVVGMVEPTKDLRVGIGWEHIRSISTIGIGGEWKPVRELALRIGIDPDNGWSAGITVRYKYFSFSFASFLIEPAGWSSLWTVEAGPQPPEPTGYRYPVTMP